MLVRSQHLAKRPTSRGATDGPPALVARALELRLEKLVA